MLYALCPMRFKFIAMRYTLGAMPVLLVLMLFPGGSFADGIYGSLDLNYTISKTETTDSTGKTTKIDTNFFNPRFTLDIDKTIFPNLKLKGEVIFEKQITNTDIDSSSTKTNFTRIRPYLELTLNTPPFNASVGYVRRQDIFDTSGSPSVTLVNEEYRGVFGWRPEGFPSLDFQYIRTNTFDEKHSTQNVNKDYFNLILRYISKGLDLYYSGTYTDTKDNLNHLESKDLLNSGRFTYSNTFFDSRVSLTTTYNISHEDVKTIAEGTGFVSFQVFPFAGLSVVNDIPETGALLPNPTLIDGNLTAGAGINIGLPPIGGDTRPRQMGLDLLTLTEVNNLFVWVDRELPADIANKFSWDIYTSSDNLNWTKAATVPSAPFGPFQNRFDIRFLNLRTRFIKVVTKPLSIAVPGASNFPNIFVTELQAFLNRPAADVRGKTTRTSHIYNLDTKTRILGTPGLYHDFSFFFTQVSPSGQLRYTLTNGLSANYNFSRTLSGTGRIAIENGEEEKKNRIAYVYYAALNANPLTTLRDSLVFSGRIEEIGGKPSDNHSIFLYNTAALYKGIDLNLNGGLTFAKQETGQSQTGTIVNFLTTIVPHPNFTLTLNGSYATTSESGGEKPSSSDHTMRGEATVSFIPFRTLNLLAGLEVISEKTRKTQINQKYGINWSPFQDGALQFNFNYSEEVRSENHEKTRNITPSILWKIKGKSYLIVSYQLIKSESDTQKTDSKIISTNLKIFF